MDNIVPSCLTGASRRTLVSLCCGFVGEMQMNRALWVAIAVLLFVSVSRGQGIPRADVSMGYSVIDVVKGPSLTANGGSGSVALNINDWLGAVGDFGLYHASRIGPGLAAGTYTFGPRFSYRHSNRFTPFTQVLLGGVRYANNGFAFGAGGGADFGLDSSGRFALRPQIEYFGFLANGSTTNTVRVSVGIVLRIGRK